MIIVLGLGIYLAMRKTKIIKEAAKLPPEGDNELLYRDENAFMEIFNAIMKK